MTLKEIRAAAATLGDAEKKKLYVNPAINMTALNVLSLVLLASCGGGGTQSESQVVVSEPVDVAPATETPGPVAVPVTDEQEAIIHEIVQDYVKNLHLEDKTNYPPLIFPAPASAKDIAEWSVESGDLDPNEPVLLIAISDAAARNILSEPISWDQVLQALQAALSTVGQQIATGSKLGLIAIPAAGYYVAISHPEIGELEAHNDCVKAQLLVNAIRQLFFGDQPTTSAFALCGNPLFMATPTPTIPNEGQMNYTFNQLEEGKRILGWEHLRNDELTSQQKIEALEAACPAGGMREVLYHLEGRAGYVAQNLLNQGYDIKDVYFHVLHNVPLPVLQK